MTLNHALRLADFRFIFASAGRYPTLTVRIWYGVEKKCVIFDREVFTVEFTTRNSKRSLFGKWSDFCKENSVEENSICKVEAIRFSERCNN